MKQMKQILTFGFLMFGFILQSQAQEVLTKINGGASWKSGVSTSMLRLGSGYSGSSVVVGNAHHVVIIEPTVSGLTITLPKSSSDNEGRTYVLVNRSNSSVSIGGSTPLAGQYFTIGGSVSTNVPGNSSVTLQSSDATGWFQIR